jgi:hypothetical protein
LIAAIGEKVNVAELQATVNPIEIGVIRCSPDLKIRLNAIALNDFLSCLSPKDAALPEFTHA